MRSGTGVGALVGGAVGTAVASDASGRPGGAPGAGRAGACTVVQASVSATSRYATLRIAVAEHPVADQGVRLLGGLPEVAMRLAAQLLVLRARNPLGHQLALRDVVAAPDVTVPSLIVVGTEDDQAGNGDV